MKYWDTIGLFQLRKAEFLTLWKMFARKCYSRVSMDLFQNQYLCKKNLVEIIGPNDSRNIRSQAGEERILWWCSAIWILCKRLQLKEVIYSNALHKKQACNIPDTARFKRWSEVFLEIISEIRLRADVTPEMLKVSLLTYFSAYKNLFKVRAISMCTQPLTFTKTAWVRMKCFKRDHISSLAHPRRK